jgi:hypothetical protein
VNDDHVRADASERIRTSAAKLGQITDGTTPVGAVAKPQSVLRERIHSTLRCTRPSSSIANMLVLLSSGRQVMHSVEVIDALEATEA